MLLDPLAPLLTAVGIYILFKIRFFYIFHPFRSFGRAFSALRSRENLAAFTLALAGTLGVGNVLGVAVGIMVGGAGSLFWLFVSAIPAAAVKYAEVLLSADGRGSMPDAVRHTFPRARGVLSGLYAIGCLFLSLVMGAALQSRSVADAGLAAMGVAPHIGAAVLALAVLASVAIGGKKIGKITMFVIPLTTIIYIIIAFSAIIVNFDRLPAVVCDIFREAFTPEAGLGGALIHVNSRAMREGFSRGLLSNEAGAGTSSLGHSTGDELPAAVRGLHGVLEVVFDTSILCTLSGIAILVSVPEPDAYSGGMELILSALGGAPGEVSSYLVALSVFAFAYSTVLCWYHYGRDCLVRLVGCSRLPIFAFVFLSFVLAGALISESVLIAIADALLLLLTLITLPTVIKNSDRIVLLSESDVFLKLKESDPRKRLDV